MKINKSDIIKKLLFSALWITSASAHAVPLLQFDNLTGLESNIYADYKNANVSPSDHDTDITRSSTAYLGGVLSLHSSISLDELFPNTHHSLKENLSAFLVFDAGYFSNPSNIVKNFDTEVTSSTVDGQIKTRELGEADSLAWIHFDLAAVETTIQEQAKHDNLSTAPENNSDSHDASWKQLGKSVPETFTCWLLNTGLLEGLFA